jgi:antitoxin (DNA-binding transcriptional repressor) of toxin-antitoxin stability system
VLTIELQEGFEGDEVVCTVDGREVARLPAVRTNLAISRADSVTVTMPERPVTVGIALPARGLRTDVQVDPLVHRYVVVNLEGGRLEATASGEMPRYM